MHADWSRSIYFLSFYVRPEHFLFYSQQLVPLRYFELYLLFSIGEYRYSGNHIILSIQLRWIYLRIYTLFIATPLIFQKNQKIAFWMLLFHITFYDTQLPFHCLCSSYYAWWLWSDNFKMDFSLNVWFDGFAYRGVIHTSWSFHLSFILKIFSSKILEKNWFFFSFVTFL